MSVREHQPPRLDRRRPQTHQVIVTGCEVQHTRGGTFTVVSIDRDRREVLLKHQVRGERPVSFPTLDLDYRLVGGAA